MGIEPERHLSEMSWKQIVWMSRGDLLAKQRKINGLIATENNREVLTVLNRAFWVCELALREKDKNA
jgi:hypothetical protein